MRKVVSVPRYHHGVSASWSWLKNIAMSHKTPYRKISQSLTEYYVYSFPIALKFDRRLCRISILSLMFLHYYTMEHQAHVMCHCGDMLLILKYTFQTHYMNQARMTKLT